MPTNSINPLRLPLVIPTTESLCELAICGYPYVCNLAILINVIQGERVAGVRTLKVKRRAAHRFCAVTHGMRQFNFYTKVQTRPRAGQLGAN